MVYLADGSLLDFKVDTSDVDVLDLDKLPEWEPERDNRSKP
jgi:hypothetical protein